MPSMPCQFFFIFTVNQYMASITVSLLYVSCFVLAFMGLSDGETRCYDNGKFTANGTYATNRGLLLSSLASNVISNAGFYNTSIGHGDDTVYGLVLCRADASAQNCSQCVNYGIQDIITNCPNQKEAISWGRGQYPPCIVHFSNSSLYGKMELVPSKPGYNIDELSSNIEQFELVWTSLMNGVMKKASMGSSKMKFATGEANLTSGETESETIYVLMQCTPDISQSDCGYCLQQAVGEFRSCCFGKVGGYTLKPSCWFRWDLYPFYGSISGANSPAQPSPPPLAPVNNIKDKKARASTAITVVIVVSVVSFLALVALFYIFFYRRTPNQTKKVCENADDIAAFESLHFDIGTIRAATNNFCDDNKLGEGGFGIVYKGKLPDGQAIAVKRWSRTSGQGEAEFKNEVLLISMLQHRNLVRLLGFCFDERERLLIYEFAPNSSLDYYIFDSNRRLLLDWKMRFKIIEGIARGILYLHEDSRARIIHRDLKASNILLDEQMNSKISDFGTARLFAVDQSQVATRRIVGTYGYMPPEYAIHGRISVKSDVFSFGVLVLEIMSGQKVTRFLSDEMGENLLTYAWRSWNQNSPLNLIDDILMTLSSRQEMLRCIHVALLCVQEDTARRPTMAAVVLMLSSHSISLPLPSRPAYFMHSVVDMEPEASPIPKVAITTESVNEVSFTDPCPR